MKIAQKRSCDRGEHCDDPWVEIMSGPEVGLAQTPSRPARVIFTPAGTLLCEGAWTLDQLADVEHQIDSLPETSAGRITCDAGDIDAMVLTIWARSAWRTRLGLEKNCCSETRLSQSRRYCTGTRVRRLQHRVETGLSFRLRD